MSTLDVLATLQCDGFLSEPVPPLPVPALSAFGRLNLALLACASGYLVRRQMA